MIPKHRPPTSPGEMLLEEFLVPMEMTQRALAEELGLSVQSVNLIISALSDDGVRRSSRGKGSH